MRVEPSIDNEEQHIAEMRPFSVSRWRAKNISVCWCCFQRACDAALSRLCDGFTSDVVVQGDQPRYRLVELHRKRVATVSVVCWWAYSHLPKGLI